MLQVFTVTLKVCGPERCKRSDLMAYLENLISETDVPAERDIFSIEGILEIEDGGIKRMES